MPHPMRFNKTTRGAQPAEQERITALERENAALAAVNDLLRADNEVVRQRSANVMADVQLLMDELGKATLEHRTDSGEVRRGPFWDVLAIDGLETWCVGNGGAGRSS